MCKIRDAHKGLNYNAETMIKAGLTNATIQLRNPRNPQLEPIEIPALADTGAVHLSIAAHIQLQLGLEKEDMDLVVVPKTREIIVNPYSPNIGSSIAK